ncbi:hypothetical protein HG536_0A08720 [Torulaspora globosa]|uniref:Mediator of RNA polymerase II transcription subunit 9 n=1 Tax=Torulaspora globosa TaxID=48254 RepID=A0A7G3ZC19_9SACH|nr:uncharacterized protein HG536_0A08720 [Torulaspora globosa]QLL31055.1 hypothetical protein HG536_0A08720 [Torulaspora globosa]
MALQNSALREVQAILLPSMGVPLPPDHAADADATQAGTETDRKQPQAGSIQQQSNSAPVATTATAEFIPQIFYSLHQIRKEPNNFGNQLETSTAFIKHRLKSCKALIANDENCKNLLSKTPKEWHEYMQNREKELQMKRKMLEDLKNKIAALQTDHQS